MLGGLNFVYLRLVRFSCGEGEKGGTGAAVETERGVGGRTRPGRDVEPDRVFAVQ